MSNLSGFRILVLGAGRSGCAAARLASAHGAEVTVLDSAPQEKFASVKESLAREGIVLECGCTAEVWNGPEIFRVVVSPGIALDSPLHRLAESTGAPIVGELEFGASYLSCPFYAVTGTNGKTTTTELLTACLAATGRRVLAAGNIGLPLSQVALEAPELDALVVEVSSFQLEHAAFFRPHVAILLNVTPDHLDRHGSLEKYRECKCRLLEQVPAGGCVIYHADLEPFLRIASGVSRSRLWLGGETPDVTGRFPAKEWLVGADGLHVLEKDEAGEGTLLMPRFHFQLQGNHNLANALAVVAVMSALGIPLEQYRGVLSDFRSGPHRLQMIANLKGVQYVDDSKATDVDAMIQALRTLGPALGKKLHLIAGGLDKGCVLGEVKTELRMYVKDVFLIGACRQRLAVEWGDQVPCQQCQSLEEAVSLAAEQAEPGDAVLLSPGCASMDMFRSYEERGERFAAAIKALSGELS